MKLLTFFFFITIKPKGDALKPRGTRPPVVPAEYLKAFPHNDLHKIKSNP